MAAGGNNKSTATIINENLFDDQNNCDDNIEWFYDVFDILDDDEQDDDEEEDLENIIEQYNQDFDFDYIDTNVDEEEMMMMASSMEEDNIIKLDHGDKVNKIVEEQILSQKLSQLSTKDEYNDDDDDESLSTNQKRQLTTPTTPDIVSKKIRLDDDDDNQNQKKDEIPEYLKSTNKIFDKILSDHIIDGFITITNEDLRQLAILKHKIAHINLRKELWTIYLKAGTGQWETQESIKTTVDRRIWPIQVKNMMSSLSSSSNNITIDISGEEQRDGQKLRETTVHQYLEELNNTLEQYQNELDKKKNDLMDYYNDDIEKAIEKFVQQHGIRPLRMKLDYKIAILQYDYDMKILEREYLQLKPTEYQIQQATRLYDLRSKYVKAEQELIELKQRILCNKPTKSMNPALLASSSMSTSTIDPMMNEKIRQQEKLTDSMIASIIQAEDMIHEYQELFDQEILQVSVNDKNQIEEEGRVLTGKLVELIYRRFKIIDKKVHYAYNFRINYFLRSHYGDLEDKINKSPIDFSPTTMIIDTSLHHQLTDEQLKLLNRGPTYVPPCQMYVSSSSSSSVSMDDIIQKQYKLLQYYLSILYAKFKVNMARSMFINKEIKDTYMNMCSISLPSSLYRRALYEKQLVQSIREHLKTNNLILRRLANQRNVFYLGNREDFNAKANEYMTKTNAFELCQIIDETNLQQTREYLNSMIRSINSELEAIFHNTKVYKDVLEKLFINVAKVQLPYLYFLPDVSCKNNDLSLKPVIVSQSSTTSRLAHFLDKLLRPLLERQAQWTTFMNGADFIRKLNQYTEERHRLNPATIFTVINITNFNTMAPHATMLITLQDFLNQHLVMPLIDNISINRIIRLTALFLHNNRFYYDNKIYRFTRGSPSGLSLTETLSNILSFEWQQVLLRELLEENEFYGRCKNQIFFTWNQPVNKLHQLLKTIDSQYSYVKLEVEIDSKIQFLNAYIENLNGTLYTSVYHDPNIQKYTLPYVIGNAKVAHSHWFRSSLIQAVRYCTSVYDFNHERIYLEITCLANGYSLEFVERRIKHFFTHFDATSLRLSLDQNVYDKLRHRLFNFISEQHSFVDKNQELEKKNQRVGLTYHYQFGPKRKFNKKLREILSENLRTTAQSSSVSAINKKIKIILTTKQQYSLNALLSQQKPSHQLLNK